ncbi:DUF4421 family protein [Flavobacterium cerinum]|uniref:DUF4421 domain-containing protein n=1 Tax=Flavobacterium cerinum TaxID=2502784 RepID=A0ABY5INM8_9FLAO|nr:DUF4421 family protein [Flavobacterium cerinum]UUC44349.1 DUF4421 domain-containing protein [Flavobacterium cerinum]
MRIPQYLLLLFFLPIMPTAFAQVDSTYIGKFPQEYSARLYLSRKFVTLNSDYPDADSKEYIANSPFAIGAGFTWGNSGLSYSYGFGFLADKSKGKTRYFDLEYHYYGRKIVLDFFGMDYKGLYYEDKGRDILEMYSDAQITNIGVFGQYVFNGDRFSYRAAFDQVQVQLKSTGSFLLGGGAYYNRVRADNVIGFRKEMYQIGPSLGYAYTWVINPRFFVTGSLTPGVTLGFKSLDDKIAWNPSLFFRFASGYNANDWSVNLSFLMNRLYVSYEQNNQVGISSATLQLMLIKRFDSQSRLLKKLPRL